MIKKLLIMISFFVIFQSSTYINAEDFKYIEIFDPKQDSVVKVVQLNSKIQNMITSWITSIEGRYKNDPATDDGYAIKIPLDPPVKVTCSALNAIVTEVYILVPENDPPCYLIFEDENKNNLSSFRFNGDVDMLSNILDFNLKSEGKNK